MTEDAIPIEELIASVQDQILNGLHNDFTLDGGIDLEVSVARATKIDGGVKLFVFNAGGEHDKESIAKVKFKLRPKLIQNGMDVKFKNEKLQDASKKFT